ncbi:MAG: undecaprenyldiphospho-muramoylpentapeptide beta-N-acetylglucosaminyltransferase, partial [Oscillospiraceae bacterium]|nr:undecaprenyldiphospho-muramoylpentapeptide beta-N-acetylglucosaminyltransferase [Oscillospiraceae bacterium]
KRDINIDEIQNAKILQYIYNMEEVMNLADIVVSRSGAMTITEIATMGKPAIFVPFPFATENHQEYNAKVLEKVGAAKMILDKDLNADVLSKTLDDMLRNKAMLREMGQNARKIAVPNSLDLIYNEIQQQIKNGNLRC